MDKNLFLKNMEEMIQIAKTNGNQIDHKELLDYFSDYELNEDYWQDYYRNILPDIRLNETNSI